MATVVAPFVGCVVAFVTMERLFDGDVVVVFDVFVVDVVVEVCEYVDCEEEATVDGDVPAFCIEECARKAERKLPKKGLFVGILEFKCDTRLSVESRASLIISSTFSKLFGRV